MLRMRPPCVFIDEIRRFVESFCACACPGTSREAQLALAVHELMQNAISASGEDEVSLVLEVDPKDDRVMVTVSNRCTDEEFQTLVDRIDRMNREPDALEHYLRVMREVPASSRGGLGLPRVRFETQLDLSASRTDGRVTVRAEGKVFVPAIKVAGGCHV